MTKKEVSRILGRRRDTTARYFLNHPDQYPEKIYNPLLEGVHSNFSALTKAREDYEDIFPESILESAYDTVLFDIMGAGKDDAIEETYDKFVEICTALF